MTSGSSNFKNFLDGYFGHYVLFFFCGYIQVGSWIFLSFNNIKLLVYNMYCPHYLGNVSNNAQLSNIFFHYIIESIIVLLFLLIWVFGSIYMYLN
jgi:hypothetical protein